MSVEIELNKYYVISKIVDGQKKEQVVMIDHESIGNEGQVLYGFYYGVYGYHEGYSIPENIRELTPTEKENQSKNHFWELPQMFYQSFPNY
ncbi:hypothetical protein CPAV1605_1316 [seawater metagenome]|uniref:Uncharacterized protein n=1 Tax=seawater metagenome TaxID=1561972 RepID=A0A5E8CL44_9ZZZZ